MAEYICKEVRIDNGGYLEITEELTRCKDCKFSKLIDEVDDWHECWHDKRVMHGDGYCSWAERKEE